MYIYKQYVIMTIKMQPLVYFKYTAHCVNTECAALSQEHVFRVACLLARADQVLPLYMCK